MKRLRNFLSEIELLLLRLTALICLLHALYLVLKHELGF